MDTHSLSGGDPTACQLMLPIIYAIGGFASRISHANNLQFGVVFTLWDPLYSTYIHILTTMMRSLPRCCRTNGESSILIVWLA